MKKTKKPQHMEKSSEKKERTRVKSILSRSNVVTTREKYTPLHWAARYGKLEVAELIIKRGVDVNQRDQRGETPLHWAARYGQVSATQLLLDNGAVANPRDLIGETPLHKAAREGEVEVAEILLNKGANVNARNLYGNTPLHLAAKEGRLQAVKVLLKQGSKMNARDKYGNTSLHLAAMGGHNDVVSFLIDSGASVDAIDNEGMTPIYKALLEGEVDTANLLLRKGAMVDVQDKKHNNNSSLHLCAKRGDVGVCRYLVENGANVNVVNANGQIPLHIAYIFEPYNVNTFIVNYFRARERGKGAFQEYMSYLKKIFDKNSRREKIAKLFIKKGANAVLRDKKGFTPLDYYVASEKRIETIMNVIKK